MDLVNEILSKGLSLWSRDLHLGREDKRRARKGSFEGKLWRESVKGGRVLYCLDLTLDRLPRPGLRSVPLTIRYAMARRKARRPAKSSEQRMERTWTGHRRGWLLAAAVAGKMPLRFSGRTGDPSPSRGRGGALLGSDNAPAENSARKSRATWSHPSSSSTSPSPQPSPRVKLEFTRRVTGPGVTWRRRRADADSARSINDMAGKPERTAEVERPPQPRPVLATANQRRLPSGETNVRRAAGARDRPPPSTAGASSGCAPLERAPAARPNPQSHFLGPFGSRRRAPPVPHNSSSPGWARLGRVLTANRFPPPAGQLRP